MKKLCRLTTYVKTYFYNILKYFFTWKNEFKYICKYVIFLLLTFLYASNPSACWSLKWKVFPCLRWMDWLKRACRILPLEYQKSSSVPVYFWAYLNINNSGLQILQINPRMWRGRTQSSYIVMETTRKSYPTDVSLDHGKLIKIIESRTACIHRPARIP